MPLRGGGSRAPAAGAALFRLGWCWCLAAAATLPAGRAAAAGFLAGRPGGVQAAERGTLGNSSSRPLNIWFGYAKEEMSCFRDGALHNLTGGAGSDGQRLLLEADLVVLLLLAHRPSAEDMALDGKAIEFATESCESRGGVNLDAQMSAFLRGRRRLHALRIHQYDERDPAEAEQALLSIWYDADKVSPGEALAYKNKFKGNASACTRTAVVQPGDLKLTYDVPLQHCPEAQAWPRYATSKATLAVSFIPVRGGDPFAIFGANLPAGYFKGKNAMVQRAVTDIGTVLGVPEDRIFVLGDMNTRLLPEAMSASRFCPVHDCRLPDEFQKQLELAKRSYEIISGRSEAEGDAKPCSLVNSSQHEHGFSTMFSCLRTLTLLKECRQNCIGSIVSRPRGMSEVAEAWHALDPKRGAGGFDLLAKYMQYPPDREVHLKDGRPTLGAFRFPTYKRIHDPKVPACSSEAPFYGACPQNPCGLMMRAGISDAERHGHAKKCFVKAGSMKADQIPLDDPLQHHAGNFMVKPQVGWLDTIGFSKSMRDRVEFQLFQDKPLLTFGDHMPFLAAVRFDA